ncbi:hypothetical protein CAPTEDRAFT_174837 [Capitella teleta]|uniref:BHLH domain-containing protein n=1 Tax=Capitella teleta TaxID=283909 RepID=R7V1A7_CAPTE|nr:hypothetical protein CAPTEDRAFT_174837 [Capitella teleta]|eukprot:ELU09476.1 hypothetical protein CAPTEDRAFT_174837 [Capitella teleta]
MDVLENTLDSDQDHKCVIDDSQDDQVCLQQEDGDESQGLALDPSLQYQIRADTGQGPVTYRVVQVTQNEEGQVVAGVPNQLAQQSSVMQTYSNGGSPSAEALSEGSDTKFTYVPTFSNTETSETVAGGATLSQVNAPGGPFYVMMSPQEVLQATSQRNIAPRTGISPRIEGARSSRDDRRRATHNEVERRRRDKINSWIVQLSKLIPDCAVEHSKSGQVQEQSKGGILAKACDFIQELRTSNTRMAESLKETERISVDTEIMRQQCEELKQENALLRAQMQQHGIVPPDMTGNS